LAPRIIKEAFQFMGFTAAIQVTATLEAGTCLKDIPTNRHYRYDTLPLIISESPSLPMQQAAAHVPRFFYVNSLMLKHSACVTHAQYLDLQHLGCHAWLGSLTTIPCACNRAQHSTKQNIMAQNIIAQNRTVRNRTDSPGDQLRHRLNAQDKPLGSGHMRHAGTQIARACKGLTESEWLQHAQNYHHLIGICPTK
jgi:hypothetical protein